VRASRRALVVDPSTLLSAGLLIALASAIPAVLVGRPFMTAIWLSIGRGPAAMHLGTPLLFDIGVFLAVIGVVLTIVLTLGEVALSED
jgi:multisubunit Na+/H+ antiporter MnhB subunit